MIIFNDKDMAILTGLIIGDGYIDDKGRIGIAHCERQKDYCIYKAKLLHTVCGGNEIKVKRYISRRNTNIFKESLYPLYGFKKMSKSFLCIRKLFYGEDRKKHINEQVLSYLSPLSIALWWLDDGCLTKKYNKGYLTPCYMLRLYTYLPKEENLLIQKYFLEKYNMKWNIVPSEDKKDNGYILRCGEREGRKFIAIIKDIVLNAVPSMSYKVILDKSARHL